MHHRGGEDRRRKEIIDNGIRLMIKHIIMWTLKDHAEGAEKEENARKVKRLLEGLKNKIKEIQLIEVGINTSDTPAAFDIVLYSEFDNIRDFNACQHHPEHL
jgi:hypothetical protein